MNWDQITFGVEIECFVPAGRNYHDVLRAAGVNVTVTGYTHATTAGWKVVPDGSLYGAPVGYTGLEFVSPVLQGEAGLEQVIKVCAALQSANAKITNACGLHVHVGARSATVSQLANLAKMWVKYEAHFDSLVPESRRANANRYCQSNVQTATRACASREQVFATLGRAHSVQRIEQIMNAGSRYFKLNFHAYATHGTVEFRQHSGSIDGAKITAWVRLVTGFTANAFTLRKVKDEPAPFEKLLRKTDRATAAYLRQRRAALDRSTQQQVA